MEMDRGRGHVVRAEEPAEPVHPVKELQIGPHTHRQIGDGKRVTVGRAAEVMRRMAGHERERERQVGELNDRKSPRPTERSEPSKGAQDLSGAGVDVGGPLGGADGRQDRRGLLEDDL